MADARSGAVPQRVITHHAELGNAARPVNHIRRWRNIRGEASEHRNASVKLGSFLAEFHEAVVGHGVSLRTEIDVPHRGDG